MNTLLRLVLMLVFCQSSLQATSIAADPKAKDLCGYWFGRSGEKPVLLELRINGLSYCSTLAKDGTAVVSTFYWTTFSHQLHITMEKEDGSLPVMVLEAELTPPMWNRITLGLTSPVVADEKISIALFGISKSDERLAPVLPAIEKEKKRRANKIITAQRASRVTY